MNNKKIGYVSRERSLVYATATKACAFLQHKTDGER